MSRTIWAISDLHLSFGTSNKKMDLFGPEWEHHDQKIQQAWDSSIAPDDIVLISGDISWAMRIEDAMPDLQWVAQRPGIKVLIRGNHDYWWSSASKVRKALPMGMFVIQNDAVCFDNIAIAGTRLWDSPEFDFSEIIDMKTTALPMKNHEEMKDEEILDRELHRLELSLQALPKEASIKIALTHYPPVGTTMAPTRASALFEKYGVNLVVFGHLHSLKKGLLPLFGSARGVRYVLSSCDYLNFKPLRIQTLASSP
jgi:predicted phosphohydrolase